MSAVAVQDHDDLIQMIRLIIFTYLLFVTVVSHAVDSGFVDTAADLLDSEDCDRHRQALFQLKPFALTDKPVSGANLIDISTHALVLGHYDLVIGHTTRAIVQEPENSLAYSLRAQARAARRDFSDAIKDLNSAVQLGGDTASHHMLMAEVESQIGHLSNAIEHFDKVLSNDPNNVRARLGRGNALRDRGDIDTALVDYACVIGRHPELAEAYFSRAIAYHRIDDFLREQQDWDRAISIKPALYWQFGLVFRHRHLFNELWSDHDTALSARPRTSRDFLNRANAHRAFGRDCAAIEDYSRAIELRSGMSKAYLGRGISFFQTQQYRNAIDDLNRALTRRRDVEALYYRSLAFKALGQQAQAFESITEAYLKSSWNPVLKTERQKQLSAQN